MEEENFTFHFKTYLPLSSKEAFDWHKREGMFERLMPPFVNMKLISKNCQLKLGEVLHCKFNVFQDVGVDSFFKIVEYEEGKSFTDEQIKGPFSLWRHTHNFKEIDSDNCLLEDVITFRVPLESFLGALINSNISNRLEHIFKYREQVLLNDIRFSQNYPDKKMHILMTGSSGFIGSELSAFLKVMGHTVTPITRHLQAGEKGIFWDIENQVINADELEGYDAIIHLAGENIMGLWTDRKKEKIYKSRVYSTKLLVNTLNFLKNPPKTFICASGGNYYIQGERCSEESKHGKGFLADVAKDLEDEALQYKKGRVVFMRTGIVLSSKGGMLKKILHSFQLGLGTRIGSGEQHLSWISMDDLIYQYYHVLMTKSLEGAVNATSPEPVTNEDFSYTLAKTLKRPCFLRLPTGLVSTVFGDMGKETLLADYIIQPEKLIESKAKFYFPKLNKALSHLLGTD